MSGAQILTLVEAKGEARVDSRVLAIGLLNQHKNVLELIERYQPTFERFGKVAFKTEAVKKVGARGAKRQRFVLLNEDQSYFLLSLSRNTEHVVDLKANLVMAFKQARAGQAMTAMEYLPGYHQMHDRAQELAAGSPNERFLHMNLNKLVNSTVGIGPGQRGTSSAPVRALTVVAQSIAIRAMDGAEDHHDGYARAKQALQALSMVALTGMGR